jgi:hypothetical protein
VNLLLLWEFLWRLAELIFIFQVEFQVSTHLWRTCYKILRFGKQDLSVDAKESGFFIEFAGQREELS